jgi:hypothetical protein
MEGKVELRVKVPTISQTDTYVDSLNADVVAGTNYIVSANAFGYDLALYYPVGSPVDIRFRVAPFTIYWTGFVASVDTINNVIFFTQPINLILPAYGDIMAHVRALTTENERLDLYEEETIQQVFQFQDVNNLAPVGQFTRDFRIPYTDNNAKVLGAYYDSNYVVPYQNVFDQKIEAIILVDGLAIVYGVCRILSIVKNKNGWDDLQLCFYGTTPQFLLDIKDRKLADITTLSWLDHVVNPFSVQLFNILQDPIIYTALQRGQNKRWVGGTSGGGSQTYFTYEQEVERYGFNYLTPCVKWSWIFEAIISGAGYQLDAPNLMDELDKYWAPWLGKLGTPIDPTQYKFRCMLNGYNGGSLQTIYYGNQNFAPAGPLNTLPLLGARLNSSSTAYFSETPVPTQWIVVADNAGMSFSDGVFEAPITANYTFNAISCVNKFFGATDPTDFALQAFVNFRIYRISDGTFDLVNLHNFDLTSAANLSQQSQQVQVSFDMEAGDRLAMSFTTNNGSSNAADPDIYHCFTGGVNPFNQFGTGSYQTGFELVSVAPPTDGGYIRNMRFDAPDVLQTDFIMDVLKMHNCVIVGDRLDPKKLRIEPIVSYLGSGGQEDWTAKLDISKDVVLRGVADLQKRQLSFSYAAGADSLSKLYKDAGRTYGEFKLENGYPIDGFGNVSDFIDGELKIQLVTQSTPCRPLWSYGLGFNLGVPAPHFETITNENTTTLTNEYTPPGLRALYIAEVLDTELEIYASSNIPINLPILSHYDTLYPDINSNDLNWAPEVPLYSVPAQPYNNLFNKYWREYLDGIYSGRARIMEAYFALDLTDILDFDFNKFYWIKDAFWRVLEIRDFKYGRNESTSVVLMKIVNNAYQCDLVPDRSLFDGSILFNDLDGNPAGYGNAYCCTSFGYTWNNTKERCYGNAVLWGINGLKPSDNLVTPISRPINLLAEQNKVIPDRSIVAGTNLTLDEEYKETLIASGRNLTINGFVVNTQVFGTDNKLENPDTTQMQGVQISGANAWTKNMGRHFGGGYRDNTTPMGGMQTGELLLYNAVAYPYSGYEQVIYMDAGQQIVLPDNTTWFITIESVASDNNGFFIFSEYNGVILNKGGALNVLYLNPKFLGDSVGNQFDLQPKIYTTAPYFEVRLKCYDIGAMGYLFPLPPTTLTCRIKYVQTR